MEKFYQLSANCSNKYKYLKKLISGDIDIRKKCSKCGNFFQYDESVYEDLVFEVSEKGKFPDCIMYGGAPNFLIVLQNTLDIFNKESVTGFNEHSVSILYKNKLINEKYYILQIYGRALYNYKKMGRKPSFYCESCGYTSYTGNRPLNYELTYLKENSWDNNDLFLNQYCTEKVVEIIIKNKLIGFDIRDIKYAMNPYYTKDLHT